MFYFKGYYSSRKGHRGGGRGHPLGQAGPDLQQELFWVVKVNILEDFEKRLEPEALQVSKILFRKKQKLAYQYNKRFDRRIKV